jgi:dihydrofolate reductase
MISIVVAIDANNGIGVGNKLPWHLPADLAHFKRTTLGQPIVMGRKTFESIGRPLPGRRNLVVSRNPTWSHEGAETCGSLDAALALVAGQDASIIGGGEIFAQAMDRADRLVVTEIDHVFACDAFFPAIDRTVWREASREEGEQDGLRYAFVTYLKHP